MNDNNKDPTRRCTRCAAQRVNLERPRNLAATVVMAPCNHCVCEVCHWERVNVFNGAIICPFCHVAVTDVTHYEPTCADEMAAPMHDGEWAVYGVDALRLEPLTNHVSVRVLWYGFRANYAGGTTWEPLEMFQARDQLNIEWPNGYRIKCLLRYKYPLIAAQRVVNTTLLADFKALDAPPPPPLQPPYTSGNLPPSDSEDDDTIIDLNECNSDDDMWP